MRLIDEQNYQIKIAQIPMDERTFRKAWETAQEMPEIEAEPVRHGTWKHTPGMNSKCSECGHYFPVKEFERRPFDINYCPRCGAKMDGDNA